MQLPDNMAEMRGSELLKLLAQWADYNSQYYTSCRHHDEAMAFKAVQNICDQLRLSGEDHIQRMATKRARGDRIWSETDKAVDDAIGAARSAFIRDSRVGE